MQQAAHWLCRASDSGHVGAQGAYGFMLWNGVVNTIYIYIYIYIYILY
jgi:TPR repeat protein